MKILKLCVAVVSLTIIIIFCIYLNSCDDSLFELQNTPTCGLLDMDTLSNPEVDIVGEVQTTVKIPNDMTIQELIEYPVIPESPTPTISPEKEDIEPVTSFAEITIKTDRKRGSYVVMPNVNENTLKSNIGWLPSSPMPGEQGVCVFMGHRDTDFSILQYLKIGDKIVVIRDNARFIHEVYKIEIVNSDSELRFDVLPGSCLALVTCYPFRYSGQAPKKIIVYAHIKSI